MRYEKEKGTDITILLTFLFFVCMKTLSTRDKLPKRKYHTMKEIQKKVLNTKGYLPKDPLS